MRRCQELPGQALFQYVDEDGVRRAIDSGQVNDYLRERMGGEFTAKDFRTWHATLHALTLLEEVPLPEQRSEAALRRCMNAVVKDVAAGLRNTPAVCRKSYINPAVFDRLAERQAAPAHGARSDHADACSRCWRRSHACVNQRGRDVPVDASWIKLPGFLNLFGGSPLVAGRPPPGAILCNSLQPFSGVARLYQRTD